MKHKLKHGLLFGCCLTAIPALAEPGNSKMDAGLQSLLTKHDNALINQNLAAAVATYAVGGNAVLLGTGPGERWMGQQAIKGAYEHFFADYDRGTLAIECDRKSSGIEGNLGWMTAVCQFTDSLNSRKRDYGVNISAVAEKQDGVWRFRTFHFSNLTGFE